MKGHFTFEATPLATITSFFPDLNALIAYSRSSWAVVKPAYVSSLGKKTRQHKYAERTLAAMNGNRLNTLQQEILVNICDSHVSEPSKSRNHAEKQPTVDLVLVVREDKHGRRRLLQTFKQINHLCLLLYVFHLLNDVHTRCSSSTDIDENRLYQGLLCKVADLGRHRSREKKGLTLVLEKGHYVPDVVLETHVDHPVGFVETQEPAIPESIRARDGNAIRVGGAHLQRSRLNFFFSSISCSRPGVATTM
jgi:hypothetical protein